MEGKSILQFVKLSNKIFTLSYFQLGQRFYDFSSCFIFFVFSVPRIYNWPCTFIRFRNNSCHNIFYLQKTNLKNSVKESDRFLQESYKSMQNFLEIHFEYSEHLEKIRSFGNKSTEAYGSYY